MNKYLLNRFEFCESFACVFLSTIQRELEQKFFSSLLDKKFISFLRTLYAKTLATFSKIIGFNVQGRFFSKHSSLIVGSIQITGSSN